jgi:hypothetical protein
MAKTRIVMLILLAASHLFSYGPHKRLNAQAQAATADSQPTSVNGLEIVVQAAKGAFAADEPMVMNVTFRNTSASAFRVPDRTQPPQTRSWALRVVNMATGRRFTGVNLRPSGAAPMPGEITPVPLQPGERQSSPVAFQMFGFVDGALDYQAAKNVFFQRVVAGRGTSRGDEIVRMTGRGTSVPQEFYLSAGAYAVSVAVQFPEFPERPNLPADVQAEKARLERDPVPLWKGGVVGTNRVEVRITPPAKSLL